MSRFVGNLHLEVGRAAWARPLELRPQCSADILPVAEVNRGARIEGLNNGFDATWLLFFEDLRADQNSDWDYNDLVIEINVRAGRPELVPLPTPANLALAGLAAMVGVLRRRT